MQGYSAEEVYDRVEIAAWRRATALVEAVPDLWRLRCHELTRAVLAALRFARTIGGGVQYPVPVSGAEVVDGKYGPVDHSWIEWRSRERLRILDVYAVGRLPMVELIECGFPLMGVHPTAYVAGETRTDIDESVVARILDYWQKEYR